MFKVLYKQRHCGIVKFCRIILIRLTLIMLIQNFGDPFQKKLRGQKHAKFSTISDDFKVRRHLFLEQIKIFEIGKMHFVPVFLPR